VAKKMKKIVLISIFISIFTISAFAQANAPSQAEKILPDGSKSDACTFFPDGNYVDCCYAHDLAYFYGGTGKQRRQADKQLYRCVKNKRGSYNKFVAPLMYLGVRIGGVSWLPTPFRWGFGKNKLKKKNE
jgi:hypothetical protein